MNTENILLQAHKLGITLSLAGDRVRYAPKSAAPPELVEALREHKAEVIEYLRQQPEGTLRYAHHNPAQCRNPFTSHEAHEFPWECDPNTCYCYREFRYPRMCQGVPCRWVWPNGVPEKESEP